MDRTLAYVIFAVIMGAGVIAWLYSLSLTLRLGTVPLHTDGADYDRLAKWIRTISLGIIFLIGSPLILIICGLVWHFVLPNDYPGARWQALRTLQIVHAIWPPFSAGGHLFAGQAAIENIFLEPAEQFGIGGVIAERSRLQITDQ